VSSRRWLIPAALVALAGALTGLHLRPAARWAPAGPGPPHLILFVVLDTVRADRLSLCGYTRPTSPTLARLAATPGFSATCEAVSPGTWTLPSHASFFTGLPVPAHRADRASRPLPAGIPTLAEALAGRGYQAAMVSANALLGEPSGLARGFELARIRKAGEPSLRRRRLIRALRAALDDLDPDRPLFLFLNIFDAHDPYGAIPEGVGWAPPQPRVELHARDEDPGTDFNRFVTGRMHPSEAAPMLERIADGYDYAIHTADGNLAAALNTLARRGWMDRGVRLVVTSDHGEFLGEHDMLRHGCFIYEPVTRVPLVFADTTRPPVALPEGPLSALVAFHLARDGALPETLPLPASVSRDRSGPFRPSADMAGLWRRGGEKLVWWDTRWLTFDLAADPQERAPAPLAAPPPALEAFVDDYRRSLPEDAAEPVLHELLQALGYIDL